ncbi:hypothetical protein ASPCAL01871 [Aspergillus calidoustus]|uniref:Uncharacterized protein n=1 Tax=Aspergillus calidoustus TaxID=454130 RepID=A0A0U4ZTF5_ASPCI|nr:hypothetical protein ASPCAL01871 [Aspergillus calidoustus]
MTHYTDYFFTSNLTDYICPNFGTFQCRPPNACAREPSTGKLYCCDHMDGSHSVCWTIPSPCKNDGSTLYCSSWGVDWCCDYDTEVCTRTTGQTNICWNKVNSEVGLIYEDTLNQLYSSLMTDDPSATTYAFDLASTLQITVSSSFSSPPPLSTWSPKPDGSSSSVLTPSTLGTTTTDGSTTTTPALGPNTVNSPDPGSHPSSSWSGGAIAAMVLAGFMVVGTVLGVIVLLLDRRKSRDIVRSGAGSGAGAEIPELDDTRPVQQVCEADGHSIRPPLVPLGPHELPSGAWAL